MDMVVETVTILFWVSDNLFRECVPAIESWRPTYRFRHASSSIPDTELVKKYLGTLETLQNKTTNVVSLCPLSSSDPGHWLEQATKNFKEIVTEIRQTIWTENESIDLEISLGRQSRMWSSIPHIWGMNVRHQVSATLFNQCLGF